MCLCCGSDPPSPSSGGSTAGCSSGQPSLIDLRLVSGATTLRNGSAVPADTKCCAAIKGTGHAVLQAVLSPSPSQPPINLTWSGGEAVSGNPLQRRVSRAAWQKHTVSCTLCGTTKTMLVYIIGAEPTGFRGDGASPFADNSNPASGALGVQAVSPASGSSVARCEIEFSVRPSDLISDGNNNLFNKADVRWDVSRDKRVRKWKGTSGASGTSWVLHDDRDHWHSDDSHDSEEDNDPWDGNGHLYGVDSPSFRPPSTWIGYVKKLRMREWVRCMIGGGAARLGSRCSDYQYWHCYRSFQKSGGTWSESSDFDGNEIVSGDPGWGNTPP